MTQYDVAWSDSENKWVGRKSRLRWVGDTIAARDLGKEPAERVASFCNELGLEKHFDFTLKDLREAIRSRAS